MERRTKTYKLSCMVNGRRVYTLLYRRWKDLRNRCQGRATQSPHLYAGLEVGWGSFAEFRAWAIRNGFSKRNCSPDRIDPRRGYTPGNVRWVPLKDQWSHVRRVRAGIEPAFGACRYSGQIGADVPF